MSGVFVRLWVVASLVGVLGLGVYDVLWDTFGDVSEDAWWDASIAPLLEVAAHDVSGAVDRDAARADLEQRLGYPVAIVPLAEVAQTTRTRWADGARLVYLVEAAGDRMLVPLDAEHALVFGPLPLYDYGPMPVHGWVGGVVGGAMALLLGLVMWPLHRSQRALERAASDMASGDLAARVDVAGSSTPRVARAFNEMAARTEDRIEAHRHLLHSVSHELRTPINRLQVAIELFLHASDEDRARHATGLHLDLEEMNALIEELTTFVRLTDDGVEAVPTALAPLVHDAVARECDHATLSVAPVTALVQPERVQRAVRNLVRNAVVHGGGAVWVTLESDGTLTVEDDGAGIPEEHRARVREPFVQLDPDTPGSGLGLALVDRIAALHGATLQVGDAEQGGARMQILWPTAPGHA